MTQLKENYMKLNPATREIIETVLFVVVMVIIINAEVKPFICLVSLSITEGIFGFVKVLVSGLSKVVELPFKVKLVPSIIILITCESNI